jgi:vancomycin resistance protein VanW
MELRHAGPVALWLRRARVGMLAARRLARWMIDDGFAPPERVAPTGELVYEVRIPIARTGAHPRLEAGKRHNVRLAATAFHGAVVAPERPLSFWRALGPATAARGFTWGMELQSGCAVPAIGGGLCVLSNALFALAIELGWSVLERHGHSIAIADPAALDATIAFPHVDLRVAPRDGVAVLDVAVVGDVLRVGARASGATPLAVELAREQHEADGVRATRIRRRVLAGDRVVEDRLVVDDRQRLPGPVLRTCLDCGEDACHARVELPDGAR